MFARRTNAIYKPCDWTLVLSEIKISGNNNQQKISNKILVLQWDNRLVGSNDTLYTHLYAHRIGLSCWCNSQEYRILVEMRGFRARADVSYLSIASLDPQSSYWHPLDEERSLHICKLKYCYIAALLSSAIRKIVPTMHAFLQMGPFTDIRHSVDFQPQLVSITKTEPASWGEQQSPGWGLCGEMAPESPFFPSHPLTPTLCLFIWVVQRLSFDLRLWSQIHFPRKKSNQEKKNLFGLMGWFFSSEAGCVRRGGWKLVQSFWGNFWLLLRALITDGDDSTICSYFIFGLTALFPSTTVDHCTAHRNRIYIFLSSWGERGKWNNFEQESEKEEKKVELQRMFVDILQSREELLWAVESMWWSWYLWIFAAFNALFEMLYMY